MSNGIVLLDSNKHKNLRIKSTTRFEYMYNRNMVPLVASEFMSAAINFPIFFIKEANTAEFKAAALLGFEQDENLYFTPEQLRTSYLPKNVQRYPFVLVAENADAENFAIGFDASSDLVNETEGYRIFDENGEPSKEFQSLTNFLSDIMTKEQATKNFIDCLIDNDLIHEASISLSFGEQGKTNLNGVYKVNEERLNELEPELLTELYEKKYLAAIYAHLTSLGQLQKMVGLKRVKEEQAS